MKILLTLALSVTSTLSTYTPTTSDTIPIIRSMTRNGRTELYTRDFKPSRHVLRTYQQNRKPT